MPDEAWGADHARAVMVFLNGDAIAEPDLRGQEIVDDSFLVLFNGQPDTATFTLPPGRFGAVWTAVVDTDSQIEAGTTVEAGSTLELREKSIIVFTRPSILPSPTSSGIGAVAAAASEAAKQVKGRGHGEPADEKPKRRTTRPRSGA